MTAVLSIEHTTQYDYEHDVILAQHLAYLRLQDSHWQKVREHELVITPEPSYWQQQHDAFGNQRSYFCITKPHRCLLVHSSGTVEKKARYHDFELALTDPWEQVRDAMVYSLEQPFVPASEFVWPSTYVGWHEDLKAYALRAFLPGRPIGEASMALCQQIYDDFTYETGSTQIHTPMEVAFKERKGVCQDFAHIMIGCLRAIGLAARYVSGYLLTTPPEGQPRLRGADASHAWVSVYCPNAPGHWLELDPTNATMADLDHICIAQGRDFGDVSPLKGIIRGGGHHQLNIAVTVEPIAATSPSVS